MQKEKNFYFKKKDTVFSIGSEHSSSGMIFIRVGGKGFSTLGSGIRVDDFELGKKAWMPHTSYENDKNRKVTQGLRSGVLQVFAYSPRNGFVDALNFTSYMFPFVFQGT